MNRVLTQLQLLGRISGWSVALLYAAFSLADMVFSLTAFAHGIPEGNPVMSWLLAHHFFVPGKVILTLFVSGLIALLYRRSAVRSAAWVALSLMVVVDIYHFWGLRGI